MKGYFGFAGVTLALSKGERLMNVDLREFKGISFEVKGNEENYYLKVNSSKVKDYNFHSYSFKCTRDWTLIQIPFSELKQSPYYGKKFTINLSTITAISFEAAEKNMEVNLSVRGIKFTK